MENREPRW